MTTHLITAAAMCGGLLGVAITVYRGATRLLNLVHHLTTHRRTHG